jgi:NADH pyrophosphatase NudC (nudix superfamily)
VDDGSAVFAADVSALAQPAALVLAGAQAVVDIRALVSAVSPLAAGKFAYARGITYWHRNQRFCGACGGRTDARSAGHHRICDQREVLEARWCTAPDLRARIADPSLGGPYRVDSIGKILIEDWLATQA